MITYTMRFMRTIYQRSFYISVLVCIVFIPSVLFTAGIPADTVNFGLSNIDSSIGLSNDVSIIQIITNIIRVVLGLLGIIVVGLIMYAGFLWMTAAGNDEKIATAKKIMTNAVIGLAIIMSAFAITQFVIRSLSDATGSGSFGDDGGSIGGCSTEAGCSPTFCNINGFNSACIDQVFYIKSISPSTENSDGTTATFMNNAVVRVVFSRPIASDMLASAAVVRDQNNAVVQTQITGIHGNRVVEIRPTTPNQEWLVGLYTVEVDRNVRDFQGGRLETSDVRGVSYPRQTQFYINRVYEDTLPPEIEVLTINNSENPEVLFVGDVLTVGLQATDRRTIPPGSSEPVGGIAYASIDVRAGNRSVYTHYAGPQVRQNNSRGSSETFTTEYVQTITSADFPTGATYSIVVTVYDIDGNRTSRTQTFIVYPASCNNGILDPGETDIDQGGICGSEAGGNCTTDSQCSPFMQCSAAGICEANPIILNFDPNNAGPENWVTIFGKYFGTTPGSVSFGYPNGTDYTWIDASFPSLAECPLGGLWSSSYAIVTVPDSLPERSDIAIRITRAPQAGETSPAFDTTIDERGTRAQFERNTLNRPGLCSVVSLDTGISVGAPGGSVNLLGRGFIENTTEIYWGTRVGRMTAFRSTSLFESIIPQEFRDSIVGVRVQNDGVSSNGVPFRVQTEARSTDPVISYISPNSTTRNSYVTLFGSGFGQPYGSVYIAATAEEARSCADGTLSSEILCYVLTVSLPDRCGVTWSNTKVVVGITDFSGRSITAGTYAVALKTVGGAISNATETITIVDGNPSPSICNLTPKSGPAPLPGVQKLSIIGSHFGSEGTVRFWDTGQNIAAVSAGWLTARQGTEISLYSDTRIETIFPVKSNGLTIPAGVPVPLVVQPSGGETSNAVAYDVNICTADTPLNRNLYQCCLAGADAGQIKPAAYACEGEAKTSGYTWRVSSGLLPRIPRVLEQCYPTYTASNLARPPSPSPATLWEESGTSACVNALVGVQFSLNTIDPSTIPGNVRMYECPNGQGRGCITTNNLAAGLTIDSIGDAQTLRIYDGSVTPLKPNTWYKVEIDTDVQSVERVVIAGREVEQRQNLLATRPCGNGTAYCFDFKTSAFGDRCSMVDAFIVPRSRTISELGPVESSPGFLTRFQVYGEANQACISISARNIGWEWNALDSTRTEIAKDLVANNRFEINQVTPNWDDIRTLFTYEEVPNQPLELRAVTTTAATPESPIARTITATSSIVIALGDPQVTTYWPNCTAACSNATLGVRFNRTMMREDFTEANVTVYRCTDRVCTTNRVVQPMSIELTDTTDRGFEIIPRTPLARDTWYRVELQNIHAIGGYIVTTDGTRVPLRGDVIDSFVWGFKTKASFDGCFINSVDISPSSYVARFVGERTRFSVIPFGTPDQCSPYGQRLNPFDYDWAWSIPLTPESYRDVVDITANTIAAVSAPGCTTNCTPAGSDRRRSPRLADLYICGNGQLDLGEECDIGMPGEVAGTTCTISCLRPGNSTRGGAVDRPECGNGIIDNPIANGRTAGESCDLGDQNGRPNSGCSETCTLTGSSPTFSGNLSVPFCSIQEEVRDGTIDAGESCEIAPNGQLVMSRNGDITNATVEDPKSYCTNTCVLRGSSLAQSWCDIGDRNTTIPECKNAISICGNGVIESGETCEVLVRGATTSSIRILTDTDRNNKFDSVTLEVATEDVTTICTPSCLLGNICGYEDLFISSEGTPVTNIWCDPLNDGCTSQCTLAGSSLDYTFLSQCRDNIVGTGEYAICEVAPDGTLFAAPSQIATAKGESRVVNPLTQVQESLITVATTRFIGIDDAGEPQIQTIAAGDRITAEAPYLLQCGYEEYTTPQILTQTDGSTTIQYNGCPNSANGFEKGVATNSCCYNRPTATDIYPELYAINVCRNTLLEVSYEDSIIDKSTLQNNIMLAMHIPFSAADRTAAASGTPLPSCADQGLRDVTNIVQGTIGTTTRPVIARNLFERIWFGIKSLFARLVDTLLAYSTDETRFSGLDGVWCDASIPMGTDVLYEPNAAQTSGTSHIRLTLSQLLNSNTKYVLLLKSGAKGISDDAGVSIRSTDSTTIYFGVPFETSNEICKIDTITVRPEEYVFRAPAQEHTFVIETQNGRGDRIVPISGVYDWRYSWAPTLSQLFVIPTDDFVSTSASGIIASRNIEAQQTAQGRVIVITDEATELGDQTGRFFTATTNLYARFCANLWGDPRETRRWQPYKNSRFNFEFWYCADAGLGSTTDDDLPLFNTIRDTSPGRAENDAIIERTFFFNNSSFNSDALGIQIFLNPRRLSPISWYGEQFGSTLPESEIETIPTGFEIVTIDGYEAITNGTTYYIHALNIGYSEGIPPMVNNIFSNIYQFSINDGAQEDTQRAFAEIMKNLRFNTNMTDFGYCLSTEPSRRSRTEVINDTLSCRNDFDCRTDAGTPKIGTSGVCSNNRTALFRDLVRIKDLNMIQNRLETEGSSNISRTFPTLQSGTFYPGYTMSRWPSWGRFIGGIPNDPLNVWTQCGDPLTTDQQTCWDPTDALYHCPAVSSVYEYVINPITNQYKLHAQFEFLVQGDAIVNDLLSNSSTLITTPWCVPDTTISPFGNTCGDGIVQPGEQCDPPGRRGPAEVCTPAGGAPNSGVQFRTCTASCTYSEPTVCTAAATCGNGIVEGDEQCDAGDRNGLYGVGCSSTCTISEALYCGNGVLDFNDINTNGTRQPNEPYYEFCEEVNGVCQFAFDGIERIYPKLYFLIDRSGSMGGSRWNSVMTGLPSVFDAFQNNADIGFGVFSGSLDNNYLGSGNNQTKHVTDILFANSAHVATLKRDLEALTGPSGSTYIGPAIKKIILDDDVFDVVGRSRNDVPKSLILIVDGDETTPTEVVDAENISGRYNCSLIRSGINTGKYSCGRTNWEYFVVPLLEQLYTEYGITTYILAVDVQSDNFTRWAIAGGTSDYYRITNPDQFKSVVSTITGCNSYSLRPGNTCNASCTGFGSYCGDGIVDSAQGEECDDGNYVNGDGCDAYCRIEVAPTTPSPTADAGTCGDGLVQSPNRNGVREVCDLGTQNGIRPTAAYGESKTYCSADCTAVLTVDPAGFCGDGVVQPEEVCDVSGGNIVTTRRCSIATGVACTFNTDCPNIGETCTVVPQYAPQCSDVGIHECRNNCQLLVNDCAECRTYEPIDANRLRGPRLPNGAIPKLALLNPLIGSNTNFKNNQQSGTGTTTVSGTTITNTYWGNRGDSSLQDNSYFSLYRISSNAPTKNRWLGYNSFVNDAVGSIIEPSSYQFGQRSLVPKLPSNFGYLFFRAVKDEYYYTDMYRTIETNSYCSDEYVIAFNSRRIHQAVKTSVPNMDGYRDSDIWSATNNIYTNRLSLFPFSVNNETGIVKNTIITSPAVPKNAIRIVVKAEGQPITQRFVGNLYHNSIFTRNSANLFSRISHDIATNYEIGTMNSNICINMNKRDFSSREISTTIANKTFSEFNAGSTDMLWPNNIKYYWWPKIDRSNTGCIGFGNTEEVPLAFIHDMVTNEDRSVSIHSITLDTNTNPTGRNQIIPFFVTGIGTTMQQVQNRNITVEVYEYNENQVPGYSLYLPDKVYKINLAEHSSNQNASFWHVFNIFLNPLGGYQIINHNSRLITSNPTNGKIRTRYCEILEISQGVPIGSICEM